MAISACGLTYPGRALPAALKNQTNPALSGLHDIEARVAPELKEPERIILALLNNRRPVIAAPLNDQAVIINTFLA
jgi:hypothetical protein